MRKLNSIYFLLFMLLIMGGFASMAQNAYGNTILGGVAAAFAMLFAAQLVNTFGEDKVGMLWTRLELGSLAVLSVLLALRVFYLHFPQVEAVFMLAGALLSALYFRKVALVLQQLIKKNTVLALAMAALLFSIATYALSMTLVLLAPRAAQLAGVLAFVLCLGYLAIGFLKRQFMVEGEKISLLQYTVRMRDRSVLVISLFLVFTVYTGLAQLNWIPPLYNSEYPRAYLELVRQAETGKEKPVNGKYRYEEFRAAYEAFVKRNLESEKGR